MTGQSGVRVVSVWLAVLVVCGFVGAAAIVGPAAGGTVAAGNEETAGTVDTAGNDGPVGGDVSVSYGSGVSVTERADGEPVNGQAFEVAVNGSVTVGGPESVSIRVREPAADETLTITPEADAAREVVRFDFQDLYGADGALAPPGDRRLAVETGDGTGAEVNVSTSGDAGLFEPSGSPFAEYVVEVLAPNGSVLAATEPGLRAIGYPGGFAQNATTGTIEVTFPRLPGVDDSWDVDYRAVNDGFETVLERDVDNTAGAKAFTVTVDAAELSPGGYTQFLTLRPAGGEREREPAIFRAFGAFDDGQLRVERDRAPIGIDLRDPESVTTGTNGVESQVPGIELNRTVRFANGSNYRFVVTDEDTGGSFTTVPDVDLATAEDVLLLNPDPVDGPTDRRALWIPQEGVGPIDASVTVSGTGTTRGVANLSVALVDAETGETVAEAGPRSYLLGFEGEYTQNSTSGRVRIAVNRSVLPRDSDLQATVYDAAADVPRDTNDAVTANLTYDPGRDAFVADGPADALAGGDYSVELAGRLPERYGNTRIEKFADGVFTFDGGNGSEPSDDGTPPEITDVAVLNETVAPGDRLVVAVNATDASPLDAVEVTLERRGFVRGYDTRIELDRVGRFEDGRVVLSRTVSPDRPNGTYELDSVVVADEAGDVARPFGFDFGADTTVVVDNPGVPPETEPPAIENVRLLNDTVSPGERVVVTADVTDASGVAGIGARFRSVADGPSLPSQFRTDVEFQQIGVEATDGRVRLAGTVPVTQVDGPYRLEQFAAVDRFDNRLSVSLGGDPTVNVTDGVARPADTTEPTVRDVAVLNDTVAPGDRLVVEVDVSDDSSVVGTSVEFGIEDVFEDDARLELERVDAGGFGDGVVRLVTTVPGDQFDGTYRFGGAEAFDAARNEGSLFPFDLGTVPTFEVVDGASAATVNVTDVRVRNDTLSTGDRLVVDARIDSDRPIEGAVARFRLVGLGQNDLEVDIGTLEATTTGPVGPDGAVRLTTTVPADAFAGSYNLRRIAVDVDGADADFFGFDLDDRIQVADGVVRDDRTPPTVTGVGLLNDSVAPGDRVVAEVTAADESALTAAAVRLEPVAAESTPGPMPEFLRLRAVDPDGAADGRLRATGRVPDDAGFGRLEVDGVTVLDADGNSVFRGSFTEVDGVDVTAGPATVAVGSAEGLAPGESVTVDLTAEAVRDLYAGSAVLRFDASVLNVTDVSAGALLTSDGAGAEVVAERIDNESGLVDLGVTRTRSDVGVSGSGTLATVTFRVDGDAPTGARSALILESATLSDPAGEPIRTVRENGSVATLGEPSLSVRAAPSYVDSPLRLAVNASRVGGGLDRIEVSAPAVGASGRVSCSAEPLCRGTPDVSPSESSWNGAGYDRVPVEVTVVTDSGQTVTETVETEVRIPGDANGDGEVGIMDAAAVGLSWRSDAGGADYDPAADLNGDGRVDVFDAVVLGRSFGDAAST